MLKLNMISPVHPEEKGKNGQATWKDQKFSKEEVCFGLDSNGSSGDHDIMHSECGLVLKSLKDFAIMDPFKMAQKPSPLILAVIVPTKELVLAGKDATAEYDELAEPQNFQDDPDVVAFRKANKVGVFIKVTPLQEKEKVIVSFKLRHDFRNQPTPIRPAEDTESSSEAVWLSHHVELDLGPVVPAAP
ncbi:dynactin subunit 4-like isoform X2 [Engystomops pustulosus]|uniref:dynactin subunit 4-like isoform X2 n=1 Tax=Engystomops pustulosus TaxID=76066 RepID=UPI003AFB2522